MKKSLILQSAILLSAFCILLFGTVVFAAELSFGGNGRNVRLHDQFRVTLFLGAADAELNAVEGTLSFPAASLDVKEIRDGNSLISLWIVRPRLTASGQVRFSGIIPGGYTGEQGALFSVVFEAKKEGSGVIEAREAKALRNDGSGTQVSLPVSRLRFLVSKKISGSGATAADVADVEPPETFTPEIAAHPAMFEGRYFLAFATQDKGWGLSSYAVYESKRAIPPAPSQWEEAESPYLLHDQTLESYIYVKAVDTAGNERVVMLRPRHPLFWYTGYPFLLLALALISGILVVTHWRTRRVHRRVS